MATRKKKIRSPGPFGHSGPTAAEARRRFSPGGSGMTPHEAELHRSFVELSKEVPPSSKKPLALLIMPSGKIHLLDDISYNTLRAAIGGGMVEPVTLISGNMIIVDEEGRMKNMPLNRDATLIVGRQLGVPIVGPMVWIPKANKRKALK